MDPTADGPLPAAGSDSEDTATIAASSSTEDIRSEQSQPDSEVTSHNGGTKGTAEEYPQDNDTSAREEYLIAYWVNTEEDIAEDEDNPHEAMNDVMQEIDPGGEMIVEDLWPHEGYLTYNITPAQAAEMRMYDFITEVHPLVYHPHVQAEMPNECTMEAHTWEHLVETLTRLNGYARRRGHA